MTADMVAQALVDWAQATLGADLKGAYAYVPAEKPDALPDVVVEVTRVAVTLDGERTFLERRLQQRMIEVTEASLSFMVSNSDPEQAAVTLREFQATLLAAWLSSITLGGRVPFRSPYAEFDYTTPFVEYEDGTKGREMTMTVAVGDLVEAD